MYAEEIYRAACAISGEESEFLELLCTAAEEELEHRLSDGVEPSDIEVTFITASALLAVSMFSAASASGGYGSYTAGEVSVSAARPGDGAALADNLRRQAELLMSPYLRDDEFWFTGVDG